MKSLPILVLIFCMATICHAEKYDTMKDVVPLLRKVTVTKLDLEFGSGGEEARRQLWERFANRPEDKIFESVTTTAPKEKWKAFHGALIVAASQAGLDTASLDHCLSARVAEIKQEVVTHIPVAAYLVTWKGKPAWVVVTKCELAQPGVDPLPLTHITITVYRADSAKEVGEIHCD